MKSLIVIPARGGSKGIPHKNIKPLNGKPLIYYTIDVARQFTTDENICVTTDDQEIIRCVEDYGLKVPFVRPAELATDTCGSNEVIQHAYKFFADKGVVYDTVILLQPTSPFRKVEFVKEAVALYDDNMDMVTSVAPATCNPYYDGYEEAEDGFMYVSKGAGDITRRQEAPAVWQWNGSVYVINPKSLMEKGMGAFTKVKKYAMPEIYSVDLDTMLDWKYAELLIQEGLV